MNPLITVIVPIYKVEKYLNRCVESIVNQTYTNLEIILVDDGSPDNCPQMCDEWAKKDSRIKVIHKENGGLSSARNAGLDVMSGKYVIFVDSDDYFDNKMIETLFDDLIETGSNMAIGAFKFVYEDDRVDNYKFTNKKEIYDSSLQFWQTKYNPPSYRGWIFPANLIVSWCKIFEARLFDNIRFEFGKIHEDEFIIHHLVDECEKIVYIDKPLYFYCIRDDSIMGTKNERVCFDKYEAFKERLDFFLLNEEKYEEILHNAFYEYFEKCLEYYSMARYIAKDKQIALKIKQEYDEHFLILKDKKIKIECSKFGKFKFNLLNKNVAIFNFLKFFHYFILK